jgi:hypothetical protein
MVRIDRDTQPGTLTGLLLINQMVATACLGFAGPAG